MLLFSLVFSVYVIRYCVGLVGSRPLVAGEELLVVAYSIDTGPMRRSGRRPPSFHAHAQDVARSTARSALHRHSSRLFRQNVQCCRHPLQGIG